MPVSASTMDRVALDLVHRVASGATRDELVHETLHKLHKLIGYDFAMFYSERGAPLVSVNKDRAQVELFKRNARRWASQSAHQRVRRVAVQTTGVTVDRDILSARERDRAPLYAEYFRPYGVTDNLGIYLHDRGVVHDVVCLGRAGRQLFRRTDLEHLRRLVPALAVATRLLPGVPPPAVPAAGPGGLPDGASLTPREREIVRGVCCGLRNREIAEILGTSPNTVRNQLVRIFQKLEVTTRAELAALAAGSVH